MIYGSISLEFKLVSLWIRIITRHLPMYSYLNPVVSGENSISSLHPVRRGMEQSNN